MKRFWVLAWCDYYPDPALDNVDTWHDTYQQAQDRVAILKEASEVGVRYSDWAVIVDMDTWSPGANVQRDKIQLRE